MYDLEHSHTALIPAVATVTTPSGPKDDCFRMDVVMDKQSYAPGEPITVTVTISVLIDVRFPSTYRHPIWDFDLYVTDEMGQDVSLTSHGATASTGMGLGQREEITARLDQPYERTFRLDELFELSAPGTYTLTVEKLMRSRDSRVYGVASKPVVFTRLP